MRGRPRALSSILTQARPYGGAVLIVLGVALLGAPLLGHLELANIAMLFPLAVLFAALWLGRGPAVLAALLSVALLDFFFVKPHFTFAIEDLQYLLTFAVLLSVALIAAELVARLRRERDTAAARADEAARARLAVDSERLRNTLLASLSHDLRSPLTALAGLAESLPLAGPRLPPAQAALAEAIRREALRTHALARDLLDLARLQGETVTLAREWVPVDELVASAVQARELALQALQLRIVLEDDLPLLRVDAVLMERVLCNLIDNALAHTPAGGSLSLAASVERCAAVGASASAGWLQLSVCDSGCGLPAGREQAIFERFVRGGDSALPGPGHAGDDGSGLGLAIVRSIVEAHGGTVEASNREQGGACFTVRLPLEPQPLLPELE